MIDYAGIPPPCWRSARSGSGCAPTAPTSAARPPLVAPGAQDITCEVAVDQLAPCDPDARRAPRPTGCVRHGIDELVEEGRRVWDESGGASGDLAAMRARSRVTEAEALVDPDGLGAFDGARVGPP